MCYVDLKLNLIQLTDAWEGIMRKITLSNGKTVEVECLSCALTSGEIEPDGGVIVETEYFHAHQELHIPLKA